MKIYKKCHTCGGVIEVNIPFDKEKGFIFFHDGKFYCSENCAISGESFRSRCEECETETELPLKGSVPYQDGGFTCKKCRLTEHKDRVEKEGRYDKLKELGLCELCAMEQELI